MPSQEDIDTQLFLLKQHRATLAHYLGQRARLGAAFEPPGVAAGIKEARESIARCKAALRDWGVAVEDLPDDVEPVAESSNRRVPRMLREPAPDFVGRANEIEYMTAAVLQAVRRGDRSGDRGAVAAITGVRGMGGVGKSELAYAVAQRLAPHFPDGQLLIELQGASRPLEVERALRRLLISLGEPAELQLDLPTLQGRFRSALHGKRMLILADDAGDALQVRPLMPPLGCALLITSRQRFTLPGMTTLDLRILPPADAERFVLDICRRIGKYAAELARLCGYLPLALRVSASLLATNDDLSVPLYLARLTDERTRLAQLRDPDSPDLDVEASLRLSYDALDTAAQQALYILSTFPLSFSAYVATKFIRNNAESTLHHLRRRSLVEWDASTNRYSLHDLIRVLASQQKEVLAIKNVLLPDESGLVYTVFEAQQSYKAWEAAAGDDIRISAAEQYRRDLELLWQHLAPDLRRVARGWSRSGVAPDLETLAMDMFSYIVFKLPILQVDVQQNIRGLLITVARRGMSEDYQRSYASSSELRSSTVVAYDEQTGLKDDAQSGLENDAIQKVNNNGILSAVDKYWEKLGQDDRQIMRLRWRSDPPLSFQQIAQQLGPGWEEAAVRQRHHRVIAATRNHLREQGLLDDSEPLS